MPLLYPLFKFNGIEKARERERKREREKEREMAQTLWHEKKPVGKMALKRRRRSIV